MSRPDYIEFFYDPFTDMVTFWVVDQEADVVVTTGAGTSDIAIVPRPKGLLSPARNPSTGRMSYEQLDILLKHVEEQLSLRRVTRAERIDEKNLIVPVACPDCDAKDALIGSLGERCKELRSIISEIIRSR